MILPSAARNVAARRHHRHRPHGSRHGSRVMLLAAIVLLLIGALLVLLAAQRAMADIPETSVGKAGVACASATPDPGGLSSSQARRR